MLELGHYTLYILHTSTSVAVTVSQTGASSLKPHSKHIQPKPTHFISSPWFITGERHLEVVSQVIVTGHTSHHDLSVIQSLPNLSSSSKPWQNPLVQQTKFSTHQVLHSDNHPTHILHPIQGHASGSPQEGQVPILFSCSLSLIAIPGSLFLSLSILLLIHSTFKQNSNYPRASVLRCQASTCHDYAHPIQQQ